MKKLFNSKFLFVAVVTILIISVIMLVGCSPFKDAPQGITIDSRKFTKIKDKRMFAEAEDYQGYIYKNGEEAFCFRIKSPDIEEGKKYPMVIFLHGMGDWGNDNSRHMYHSLIDSVEAYVNEPTFVFMPQAVKNWDWSDKGLLSDKGGMDKLYNECLDKLIVQYPIDPSRVYLTGMSMGGHGTIWQATQHSEKYAAIMPVCGLFYFEKGGIQVSNLEKIINKPMWFFHSRNDDAVEFSNSPRLIAELEKLGATNIKSTWFDEPLHDITKLAYDNAEVWQWLFSQRLN